MTDVFDDKAELEGAFRFLESDAVSTKEVAAAAHRACAERCYGHRFVYVPVDGTSIAVTDRKGERGLGLVGAHRQRSPGLHVMSAIGLAPDGTPLGVLAQTYWSRGKSTRGPGKNDYRAVENKETRYLLETIRAVHETLTHRGARATPWFQIDRGGDAWPVLLETEGSVSFLTVRAAYSRRLRPSGDKHEAKHLWDRVSRTEPLGSYLLEVPRQGRAATLQLQSCPVTLDLKDLRSKRSYGVPMWAVRAVEVGQLPAGVERIEWLLLTTFPVSNLEAADMVVAGYATRWRIEEFHRVWKTGACNVEDTQLRTADRIERWATILASVAMRLMRLMYLSRNNPDLPATVELTPAEVKAIILAKKPPGVRRNTRLTIGQAVLLLAQLGGYTGKSSGGPPGAIVLQRGLEKIEVLARVLSDGSVEM